MKNSPQKRFLNQKQSGKALLIVLLLGGSFFVGLSSLVRKNVNFQSEMVSTRYRNEIKIIRDALLHGVACQETAVVGCTNGESIQLMSQDQDGNPFVLGKNTVTAPFNEIFGWQLQSICVDNALEISVAKRAPNGNFLKDPLTGRTLSFSDTENPLNPIVPSTQGFCKGGVSASTGSISTQKVALPMFLQEQNFTDPPYTEFQSVHTHTPSTSKLIVEVRIPNIKSYTDDVPDAGCYLHLVADRGTAAEQSFLLHKGNSRGSSYQGAVYRQVVLNATPGTPVELSIQMHLGNGRRCGYWKGELLIRDSL